jgi:hypothetical protein
MRHRQDLACTAIGQKMLRQLMAAPLGLSTKAIADHAVETETLTRRRLYQLVGTGWVKVKGDNPLTWQPSQKLIAQPPSCPNLATA